MKATEIKKDRRVSVYDGSDIRMGSIQDVMFFSDGALRIGIKMDDRKNKDTEGEWNGLEYWSPTFVSLEG